MNARKKLYNFMALFFVVTLLTACSLPGFSNQPGSGQSNETESSSEEAGTEPGSAARPVIIDTDMATDDWMAILYLLQRTDISVIAITVSGTGEAHCEQGVKNALGLVALADYAEIPVTCGRETPLKGEHSFPSAWRSNVDSLGGMTLPEGGQPSTLTAVELIASLIETSPARVTLMTLGPLTTLAETLLAKPALAENIAMIYIMGGAVFVPGNIEVPGVGINNKVAEWNIYVDPYAAQVVFESGAPIALVALDATNDVPVTKKFYKAIKKDHSTPAATWIYDLFSSSSNLYENSGMYFWDTLTAVVLSDENVAEFHEDTVCVLQDEGPLSGQTISKENCPAIRVAVSADREGFERMFLAALNGVSEQD